VHRRVGRLAGECDDRVAPALDARDERRVPALVLLVQRDHVVDAPARRGELGGRGPEAERTPVRGVSTAPEGGVGEAAAVDVVEQRQAAAVVREPS
jgi:hypothetical protein